MYRHTTPIFTHSLYVYAGETIMPPPVLASKPNPCGGKNPLVWFAVHAIGLDKLISCFNQFQVSYAIFISASADNYLNVSKLSVKNNSNNF